MKELLKKVMKGLAKLLAKANLWYEKLEERKRFIFATIYGPVWFLVGLGAGSGQGSFYLIGLFWVVISVIALRAWWLYGNLRSYLEY